MESAAIPSTLFSADACELVATRTDEVNDDTVLDALPGAPEMVGYKKRVRTAAATITIKNNTF